MSHMRLSSESLHKRLYNCLSLGMSLKRLRNLFGSAAEALEKLILRRLCQRLDVKLELKEGYKFSDYISALRKVYVEIEVTR